MVISLYKSIFGPQLYRIFKHGSLPSKVYSPNNLEFYSNSLISLFRGFYVLCKWTSPVILAFAYYRGYFTIDGIYFLCRVAYFFGFALMTAYVARGFGRCSNLDYQTFIKRYAELNKKQITPQLKAERRQFMLEYDFQMSDWHPDFIPTSLPPIFKNESYRLYTNSVLDFPKYIIWRLLSTICVDTFGLRMMYPGVVIKNLIGKALLDGRKRFIEQKRAQRAIIESAGRYRNKIDTLFMDQRNSVQTNKIRNFATLDSMDGGREPNGNYLFVCCDGNASFYEVGIYQIPIENGYSCLGWNYPGFGESTGLPYPVQLTAAADAVMQYAFSLGFKEENIVLFSWSIGGFAVSWLSNQYPNVKACILDACFDSITPLAQQQMPKFASDFVEYAIKHNLNLDVAKQIGNYQGPLMFIRRTQDEIISTIPRVPSANRGNDLLLSTLRKRYPHIVNDDTLPYIRTWLSAKSDQDRDRIMSSYSSDISACESLLAVYVRENPKLQYPITLGKSEEQDPDDSVDSISSIPPIKGLPRDMKLTLALYLADKYLLNYESSHCQPLPRDFLKLPWSEHDLTLRYSF